MAKLVRRLGHSPEAFTLGLGGLSSNTHRPTFLLAKRTTSHHSDSICMIINIHDNKKYFKKYNIVKQSMLLYAVVQQNTLLYFINLYLKFTIPNTLIIKHSINMGYHKFIKFHKFFNWG
ncbi:hypothetical protein BpHYR1_038788 [Brachionus plicatilis]|uniref:Uncharacterized protein n=1 Tax=Brachionus plicatilis TaxID=10195 RepID=A0A3M7SZ78_BRAPC|nr:hypothetical protein BpHYR1_038788 [Brachionus plicatilis]